MGVGGGVRQAKWIGCRGPGGQEKVGPAFSAAMATGYPSGGHRCPSECVRGALLEAALREVGAVVVPATSP